jgi:hypothetical protein
MEQEGSDRFLWENLAPQKTEGREKKNAQGAKLEG